VDASALPPDSERSSSELDDVDDREELRSRFDMLLQELRVALPGVQVLSAFLLTAPFAQRFAEMDDWERRAFGVALTTSMLSVVCLLAPTLLHRLGLRTARSQRLSASIVLAVVGLALLAVAVLSALWAVARFVFGHQAAWWITAPVLIAVLGLWVVVPMSLRRHRTTRRNTRLT
jgi:MFS family permease